MDSSNTLQVLPDPWTPDTYNQLRAVSAFATIASGTQVTTANDAIYVPVVFPCNATLYALYFTGTSATGNYDLGFYDAALNRLASKGSTALADATQTLSLPELRVRAGELFYAALALSNNTATISRFTYSAQNGGRAVGLGLQASALPLPNPGVPGTVNNANVPVFAFGVR